MTDYGISPAGAVLEVINEYNEKETEKLVLSNKKWRNILFDNAGKAWRGITSWNSLKQAKAEMKLLLDEIAAAHDNNEAVALVTLDGELLSLNYSWNIQVPVD